MSLGACAVEVLMLGDWRAAAGEVGFWPECGHLARPTLGWKSQTGRPKRKRFAFHTRSMGTARPGASAQAGQHLPQHVATCCSACNCDPAVSSHFNSLLRRSARNPRADQHSIITP